MRTCSPQSPPPLLSLSRCTFSIASTWSPHGRTCSPFTSPGWRSPARALSSCTGWSSPTKHIIITPIATTANSTSSHWRFDGNQRRYNSSKRWVQRQTSDPFTRAAKVAGLKSRAAFKLIQINDRYRLFRPGMTVIDLGFAPGSWSQVAVDLTQPAGRVLGVDLIPAQPPKGVNTIQGDFLSPAVQDEIKDFLRDPDRGRVKRPAISLPTSDSSSGRLILALEDETTPLDPGPGQHGNSSSSHSDLCVDLVLSDMSAPWDQLDGFHKKSVSNPYHRLMNTSGNAFRDHAGSMDLCTSALRFCFSTLKVGGHFVCKFYQGAEDKLLEKRMKAMFHKVAREKPESSRSSSKEAYMVGIKRLAKVDEAAIFAD